ncbi:MAG: orotate phosphoribosyltransferase [Actinobacteria bacterium]|nr:orotate phosphoribosyltransferase [Actinomycetota bacterium]
MELSTLALRIGEVAQLSGQFVLRSGATSNTYFDKYLFESDPQLLRAIAEHLVPMIPEGTELLAGLELGGVPVATALSYASGLPAVFVRKKAKDYGTAKLAEGPSIDGKRVLIVEDIITSGGQVVLSTKDLRDRGAIVHSAVCVIDREQGGSEALADSNIALGALFTRSAIESS